MTGVRVAAAVVFGVVRPPPDDRDEASRMDFRAFGYLVVPDAGVRHARHLRRLRASS